MKIRQYVSPTDRLFEVVNTDDDVHLALSVFEKDLNKISVGQRVLPTPIKIQKKYAANIISHREDFQPDKSVVIYCHFIDYDKNLIPGTYMNAEVETNSGLGIPFQMMQL